MNPSSFPPVPPDDPHRNLVIARPDKDSALSQVSVVGGIYTVLLSGADTAGRHCLIDMHVPSGGGPPPHRHDFEETFSLLEGELEFTFRGTKANLKAGETLHVPANAPHHFQNISDRPARLLCTCSPAGQEEFFVAVGVPVASRTTAAPPLDAAGLTVFRAKSASLLPQFKTEMVRPA